MLEIRRVVRYDARHGQPYEDYEAVDVDRLRRMLRAEESNAQKERQAELNTLQCPKCRSIRNADGTCEFCYIIDRFNAKKAKQQKV